MTEYLLDTSLIRSLSAGEERELSGRKGAFSLTASYIAPFELLSGTKPKDDPMAESENKLRKAALGRYYRLVGFDGTYWEDEDVLICKAFGIKHPSRDTSDLKQLIRDCVNARHLDEIESPYLKEIRQMDTITIHEYRAEFESFSHEARGDKTYILVSLGIIACTGVVPEIVSKMTHEEVGRLAEKLRSRYNGSLDLVIDSWFEYVKEPRTFQRACKKMKNDVFDWKHILYLRVGDTNQFFITEDRDLLALVKKVAPDRVLDKIDFFNRICAGE